MKEKIENIKLQNHKEIRSITSELKKFNPLKRIPNSENDIRLVEQDVHDVFIEIINELHSIKFKKTWKIFSGIAGPQKRHKDKLNRSIHVYNKLKHPGEDRELQPILKTPQYTFTSLHIQRPAPFHSYTA